MDWRDSEASEEEIGHDQQTSSRKRSSRGSRTPLSYRMLLLMNQFI